jgi:hypothetical protein
MLNYWDEAVYLLETLVMKAAGQDPNGMDLLFTHGDVKVSGKDDAAKFRRAMTKAKPVENVPWHTNMSQSLGAILQDHLDEIEYKKRTRETIHSLTIVVLTDGIWEGMNDKDDVRKKIIEFDSNLKAAKIGNLITRPVSIQFIQFGSDEDARELLRRLDDDMPYYGVK